MFAINSEDVTLAIISVLIILNPFKCQRRM